MKKLLLILSILAISNLCAVAWPAMVFNPTNGKVMLPTNFYSANLADVAATVNATNLSGGALIQVTNISDRRLVSGLPAYVAQAGVTVEQFGARGDCQSLYDASSTNGSQIVYSPSAPFTAADVGKTVCLYTDQHNTNWLVTTITNVISSSRIQLSNAPTVTCAVGQMRFGTDATAGIQAACDYAITNFIPNVYFSNAVYMVAGALKWTGTNMTGGNIGMAYPIYSIIRVGNDSFNLQTTNAIQRVALRGVANAVDSRSGYHSLSRSGNYGTIIFCPTVGIHAGDGDYLLSMTGPKMPVSWSHLAVIITDIGFYTPVLRTIGIIDNAFGGPLLVDGCQFDWDFYRQDKSWELPSWQGIATAKEGSYVIKLAENSNDGNQQVTYCEMNGGWNGIYANDHSTISHTRIVRMANGLVLGNGLPTVLDDVTFDVNWTNIACGWYQSPGNIMGNCKFLDDDTRPQYGVIAEWNGQHLNGDLAVWWNIREKRYYHDGTMVTNLSSPLYQGLNLNVIPSQAAFSDVSSNFYGSVLTRARFPKGVWAKSNEKDDYSSPMIWGIPPNNIGDYVGAFFSSQYSQFFINILGNSFNLRATGGTVPMSVSPTGNATFLGSVTAPSFVGSGSSLTTLNASQITSGTLPDAQLSTNIARQADASSAAAFADYVNLPLMTFNPPPGNSYSSGPFYTQPFLNMASINGYLQIPAWVTNCVTSVLVEWGGAVPLTYTNSVASDTRVTGLGRWQDGQTVNLAFTIAPTTMAWFSVTNTWKDWGTTNVRKSLQFQYSGSGPTNVTANISIVEIRQARQGVKRGTNY